MFRVIVAGSRGFNNYRFLAEKLDRILSGVAPTNSIQIVSGCARGADSLAILYAKERGYEVAKFPAEWDRYGKSAGYRRNEEMARHADALVAFWDGESRGTRHMIDIACSKGMPVRVLKFAQQA